MSLRLYTYGSEEVYCVKKSTISKPRNPILHDRVELIIEKVGIVHLFMKIEESPQKRRLPYGKGQEIQA
jgi:hypothetical protein